MIFWQAAKIDAFGGLSRLQRTGKIVAAVALIALAPLMSGCMSSPGSQTSALQSAAEEVQDPAVTTELPVASQDDVPEEGSAEDGDAIATEQPSDTANIETPETAQSGLTPERETIASAIIIPTPAPRASRTQEQLNNGIVMAFADTGETDPSIEAISVPDDASQPQAPDSSLTTGSLPPSSGADAGIASLPRSNPGGLFGLIQARQMARARTQSVTGNPEPPANTAVRQAALSTSATNTVGQPRQEADDGALPGVQSSNELFGLDEEEHDEENPLELASAGGLARLSPNGLTKQREEVDVACFKPNLVHLLKTVEAHYGKPVIVTSGYRSPTANQRAGGASNSRHTTCEAADIQILGVSKWDLAKYLRTVPGRGGVGTYCRTDSVHVDVGTERDWHHPCRRSTTRSKA